MLPRKDRFGEVDLKYKINNERIRSLLLHTRTINVGRTVEYTHTVA
jgi:hypothetical protein